MPSRDGTSNRRAAELISEWVYRALLVLYPSEHRREYEEQMVQLFGDRMRRDGGGYRSAIVWLHILSDLFHSALNEHLERVGLWGVIKALLYPAFLSKFSPQTARTKSEVAIALLVPCLIPIMFFGVVMVVSFVFSLSELFREAFVRSAVIMLLGAVFMNPVFLGMTFRLRRKYDLRGVLLATAIYWPIFIFITTPFLHFMFVLFNDDTPILAISEASLFIAFYFGTGMCIFAVLVNLLSSARVPAPSIVAHRNYRLTEMGVSLTSLIGIGVLLLLAM